MSEDTQGEQTPDEVQKPEPTAIELKAMEMGWRPKEEWHGEEDGFVEAKEFVARAPLFEKIDTLGKKYKQVEQTLENLKQHYTKVEAAAFDRALKQLKAERKLALTDGDGDRFEQIDDQIKEVEQQARELEEAAQQPAGPDPAVQAEFVAWTRRNVWYTKDQELRDFADSFGVGLAQRGASPQEVMSQVERAVRKQFPQKFTNPNKKDVPHTESSSGVQKASKKDDYQLSETERKVMNDFVRSGIMTKEEYIDSLKKASKGA
jgi:hypothetical protein